MDEVACSPGSPAMYINKGLPWSRNQRRDCHRIVDWSKDGRPIGIVLRDVRRLGVDVTGLPERETVERIPADQDTRIRQRIT